MKQVKTNAMRILDSKKLPYEWHSYDNKDGKIDGISVANKINKDPKTVYKTLVTQGNNKEIFVFVVPVEGELDLKKAAKEAGEKKVEMIHVKDIQKLTGYIRGGCSPIGMKKQYPTFIDESAKAVETLIVSGGKIGLQIEIKAENLITATGARFADVVK